MSSPPRSPSSCRRREASPTTCSRTPARSPTRCCSAARLDGGWDDVTAAEFHAEVRGVAKGLIAAGVEPGDRVALMSRTRYEWTLLDYAIWYAGAVTVPIYETSSAEQVDWILSDSGARAVVVESADHLARVAEVRAAAGAATTSGPSTTTRVDVLHARSGADVSDDELETRRAAADPGSTWPRIIYTSGTTGPPKGCLLTHGNFMAELGVRRRRAATSCSTPTAPRRCCSCRWPTCSPGSSRSARSRRASGSATPPTSRTCCADLAEFQPTFLLAVPRVFEKVFNTARSGPPPTAGARSSTGPPRRRSPTAARLDTGRSAAAGSAPARAVRPAGLRQAARALGGRCRYAISGGAPLGERLGHFFRGIGVTVLEGYGLTETTAAITVNLPGAHKIGTVGRPLPGVTVRIADDGELLVRGGQVLRGLLAQRRAPPRRSSRNGWFHTGDIGEIDDEGFVRITGRKKEILVTAGGKNVAPAVLEDRIRAHPWSASAWSSATASRSSRRWSRSTAEAFAAWAEAHGKTGDARATWSTTPTCVAEVQAAVDEANEAVSQAESIRKFTILPVDWTEEGGQLTPSLKLKRNVVMREFRARGRGLFGP